MSPMRHPKRLTGYTLIEILIAASIFSALSLAAYTAVDSLARASVATEAHAAKLARIQYFLNRFSSDAQALVSRPQFNDDPSRQEPALVGDAAGFRALRSGWDNPLNQPRSNLQRFEWIHSGTTLQRRHWPTLYQVGSEPLFDDVLEGVDGLSLRYLDASGRWRDRWGDEPGQRLPRAIEAQIRHADFGLLRRVWVIE